MSEATSVFPAPRSIPKQTMTLGEAMNFEAILASETPQERRLGGYRLPDFQRPLVWTPEQEVLLIESIWDGFDIGAYAITEDSANPEFDGFLLDGQQRLNAIMRYCADQFPVRGYLWSELTIVDRRNFTKTTFPRVVLRSPSDEQMRTYYNRMNFGGVRHTEDQRA